jgi:hypothetical protein
VTGACRAALVAVEGGETPGKDFNRVLESIPVPQVRTPVLFAYPERLPYPRYVPRCCSRSLSVHRTQARTPVLFAYPSAVRVPQCRSRTLSEA